MKYIRKANLNDLDAIMQVISEARAFIVSYGSDQWQDGYPESEVILGDIEQSVGYVFENESGIHAYCAIIPGHEPNYDVLISGAWKTETSQYVTIHRLATDNSCRGQGVGTQIAALADEIARENKLTSIRADTHRKNAAMQGLLKKNGFEYCGDVSYQVTFGDPIRVCYEKVLAPQ